MDTEMMVELHHVKEYFRIHDQLTIRAVDDISFGIRKGEVFGLVGESGCGKSTVARLISGIYRPTEGEVLFHGNPKKEMQMIFQDSAASLNPRMTVEQIILEPLWIQGRKREAASFRQRLEALLEEVGLSVDFLGKYPGALSGGQRQRVAIARSLLLQPGLIVADEPIASLDISIQAQIVTLQMCIRDRVDTPYGPADVKVCMRKGKTRMYPEYESVKKICQACGEDFQTVYHSILQAAMEQSRA